MGHPGRRSRIAAQITKGLIFVLLTSLSFSAALPIHAGQAPASASTSESLSDSGSPANWSPQNVGAYPLNDLSLPKTVVSSLDSLLGTGGVIQASSQNLTLYNSAVKLRLLGGPLPHDELLTDDNQLLGSQSFWTVETLVSNSWVPLAPRSSNFTILGTNSTGSYVTRTMRVGFGAISGTFEIDYKAVPNGPLKWTLGFTPLSMSHYRLVYDWTNISPNLEHSLVSRSFRAVFGSANYTFSWSDIPSSVATNTTVLQREFMLFVDLGIVNAGSIMLVDPSIVSTNVSPYATALGFQRHVFYESTGGNYFVFYYNGTNVDYRSSHDGTVWSSPNSMPNGWQWTDSEASSPAVLNIGTKVYVAAGTSKQNLIFPKTTTYSTSAYWVMGTIDGPKIVWGPINTLASISLTYNCNSFNACGNVAERDINIGENPNGDIAFSYNQYYDLNGYCNSSLIVTFSHQQTSYTKLVDQESNCPSIFQTDFLRSVVLPADSQGRFRIVYQYLLASGTVALRSKTIDSSGNLGSLETIDTAAPSDDEFSALADSDYGNHLVWVGHTSNVTYAYHSPSASSSWGPPSKDILSSVGAAHAPRYPTITLDAATGRIYLFAIEPASGGQSSIAMRVKQPSESWFDGSISFPISDGSYPNGLGSSSVSDSTASGSVQIPLIWTDVTGSCPFCSHNAIFASIPISSNWSPYGTPEDPWDGNGLAPYGQYFSNLGEYVSPSDGMLTITQTDLSVPGRGLNLDLTRIYTEPQSFLNGVLGYDIYPWAPMGDGWALNFPWMENVAAPAYMHLWNGQGYRIPSSFWNTPSGVFENHQGENFQMVRNATGIFLFGAGGNGYLFDPTHSNRLETIFDPVGNMVQFAYTTGNLILSITDTVQRIFQFNYNGGVLASINQTSNGSSLRGIVFKYNGTDLSRVYDTAGRVTSYTYNSFGSGSTVSPWLVSRVTYPTGWYMNYTFVPALIGTDAESYRVSTQYVGGSNVRVREFDYKYSNGPGNEVNNSTVTTFDGVTTQPVSFTLYAFSSVGVTWNLTDGNHNFVKGEQQRFGPLGRVVQDTTFVSPTQGYSNYYSYDRWGNMIYKDLMINPSANWSHEAFNAYYNDGLTPGFRAFQETFSLNQGSETENPWSIHSQLLGQSWTVKNGNYNGTDPTPGGGSENSNFAWVNMTKTDLSLQARVYIGTQYQTGASAGIFVRYGGTGTKKLSLDLAQAGATTLLSLQEDFNGNTLYNTSCSWTNATISGSWYTFNLTIHGSTSTGWVARDGQVNLCGPASGSTTLSGGGFGLVVSSLSARYTNITATTVTPTVTGVGFSNSFINNGGPNQQLRHLTAGMAQLQNVTASQLVPIETYYGYTAWGGLSQTKRMYNPGSSTQWLTTSTAYDQYGNPIIATSPQGRQDFYSYDSTNNIDQHAYITNHTRILTGSSTKIITLYMYNLTTGNILQVTDPNRNVTSYTNDNLGRTTSITYPAGLGYVKYVYNDQRNYIDITNENGWLTRQVYDGLGRLSTVERFSGGKFYSNSTTTYNWMDEAVNQTDPLSRTTTSQYDAAGRLTTVIEADGNRTSNSYNTVNSWVIHSGQYGNLKCEVYDRLGRLISVVEEASSSCTGIVTNYYYDEVGNLLRIANSKNQTTNYAYDDLNRLLTTTYPGGSKESYQYDNDGLLIGKVDRMGVGTSYLYDSLGRLTSFLYPWMGFQESDNYTYDKNSNLLSLASLNATVSYTYDARNRAVSEFYNVNSVTQSGGGGGGGGSVAEGTLITLANGTAIPVQNLQEGMQLLSYNVTSHMYAVSSITRMAVVYTSNMLVIKTTDPLPLRVDNATAQKLYMMKNDGSIGWFSVTELRVGDSLFNAVDLKWTKVVDIEYAVGGIHKMYDIYTSAPFDYLANNYLDPPKSPSGPSTPSGVVRVSYAVKYAYKGENTMSITYCGHSPGCIITDMILNYTYDDLGRVTNVRPGASSYARFYYFQNDEVKSIEYGNTLLGNYTYDKLSRVSTISLKTSGYLPTTLLSLSYGYNRTGTVASIVGQSTTNTGSTITVNEQYAYDPLQRLTSASLTNGSNVTKITYQYDSLGNRITQSIGGTTSNFTYNSLNELTYSTLQKTVYGYDKNGELTLHNQTASPTQTGSYIWNHKGEMLQYWLNGAIKANYAYDGMHRRVESKEGTSTIFYAYLGTDSLYDLNYTSNGINMYFFAGGMRIAELSLVGSTSTTTYFHEDAVGSIRLVTDSNGNVVFSDNYQPFGQDNSSTGSSIYKFTGKPVSQTTGLYYEYARWYDPTVGRFISPDPKKGHLWDPQTLNQYVYAVDQPTGITDPSGMDGCGIFSSVCGFANTVWNGGTSVASTAWNDVSGGASYVYNTAANGYNSLSPEEKQALWIGVGVVAIVATGGAAAPLVLGIGLAAGAGAVGLYAGYSYATGQQMTLSGALTAFSIGFAVGSIAGGIASSAGLLGDVGTAAKSVEFAPANSATGFPGGVAKVLGHMPGGGDQEEWLSGVWDIANNPAPETTTVNPGGGVRVYGLIDDYMVRVVIGRWGTIINAFPIEALTP